MDIIKFQDLGVGQTEKSKKCEISLNLPSNIPTALALIKYDKELTFSA